MCSIYFIATPTIELENNVYAFTSIMAIYRYIDINYRSKRILYMIDSPISNVINQMHLIL
jgi:hypothetical protein